MTNCCECEPVPDNDQVYRRILYLVLALNAAMFFVETAAGYISKSASLQADAIDFLGDALNYISALYVLRKTLKWKSGAALVKGIIIGLFGVFVLGNTLYHWSLGVLPAAGTMGIIGIIALIVNIGCALLLFRFRKGDSNRASVWICSRNDAIANILVICAGVAVYYSGTQLPDLIASFIIAGIAMSGSVTIIKKARTEFKSINGLKKEKIS